MNEQYDQDSSNSRARYYSSMNYNEYISVFEKPPQKPQMKPLSKEREDELLDLLLEERLNITNSSKEGSLKGSPHQHMELREDNYQNNYDLLPEVNILNKKVKKLKFKLHKNGTNGFSCYLEKRKMTLEQQFYLFERKSSQSVNFVIGKHQILKQSQCKDKSISSDQVIEEELKVKEVEEEEDTFENEFSISQNKEDQGYKSKNRNRSYSENYSSIFGFLNDRSRKHSLVN